MRIFVCRVSDDNSPHYLELPKTVKFDGPMKPVFVPNVTVGRVYLQVETEDGVTISIETSVEELDKLREMRG